MKEKTNELYRDYKFTDKAQDTLHEILKTICGVCTAIPPRAKPVSISASELVNGKDYISRVIAQ